jgi:hypothetical protein
VGVSKAALVSQSSNVVGKRGTEQPGSEMGRGAIEPRRAIEEEHGEEHSKKGRMKSLTRVCGVSTRFNQHVT